MGSVKRLTPLLAVLTVIAVVNIVLGGLHLIASGDPLHRDRLAISLAASLLLSAWALRRLRIQWLPAASPPADRHSPMSSPVRSEPS
jgi:hypothetical protein